MAVDWDLETAAQRGAVGNHTADIYALDADGPVTATASKDRTVQIWDTRVGRAVAVLREHMGSVLDVRLRHYRVVSASLDKTVKMWDLRTPQVSFRTLDGHSQGVHCVDFSDELVVSGGVDTAVRIWQV